MHVIAFTCCELALEILGDLNSPHMHTHPAQRFSLLRIMYIFSEVNSGT